MQHLYLPRAIVDYQGLVDLIRLMTHTRNATNGFSSKNRIESASSHLLLNDEPVQLA